MSILMDGKALSAKVRAQIKAEAAAVNIVKVYPT